MDSNAGVDTRAAGIGAGLGAAGWILGYLVTYVLAGPKVRNAGAVQLIETVTGDEVTWKIVGWIFYNAHLVEITMDAGLLGTNAVNFIARSDGNAWVLYLLPPLVLLVAGALAARLAGRTSAPAGAKSGLLVVPGYFVFSVVGVLVFGVSSGSASAAPDLLMAATLAGLVYPALFGALGGAAAAVFGGGGE